VTHNIFLTYLKTRFSFSIAAIFILLATVSSAHAVLSDANSAEKPARLENQAAPAGGVIVKPKLKPESCGSPIYPDESRRLGEEGNVGVNLYIDVAGAVVDAQLVNSSGFSLLDEAALKFMSQCKFYPATQNGAPVAMWKQVRHVWRMADDPHAELGNKPAVASDANSEKYSFIAENKTERFPEYLNKMCSTYVQGFIDEPANQTSNLAAKLSVTRICTCVELAAKKDKYLKLLFSKDDKKLEETLDWAELKVYVLAKTGSHLMSCISHELDAAVKDVDPIKKK